MSIDMFDSTTSDPAVPAPIEPSPIAPALPRIDPRAERVRLRLMASKSKPVTLLDTAYALGWVASREFTPSIALLGASGDLRFVLLLDNIELIPGLSVDVLLGLPAPIRVVLALQAAHDVLDRVARLTEKPCSIDRVSTRTAAAYAKTEGLDFDLRTREGGTMKGRLIPADNHGWTALERTVLKACGDQPVSLPSGPLRALRAVIGTTQASSELLRELELGDVLLIESQAVAPVGFALFDAHGRCVLPVGCQFGSTGARVAQDANTMTSIAFSPPSDAPPGSIDQIEMRVSFELGEVTLTAHEIEDLRNGSVLQLESAIEKTPITIRANGRVIGVGQLVSIEDHLGVQITKLHIDGH